jgi:LPS O-antigen subunit length determinant protein (WzzB/FepE family)
MRQLWLDLSDQLLKRQSQEIDMSKRIQCVWQMLIVCILLAVGAGMATLGLLVDAQTLSSQVLVEQQASGMRFAVQHEEDVAAMRLEVLRLDGSLIFDSQWILDRAVLWPLVDQTGQQAAPERG